MATSVQDSGILGQGGEISVKQLEQLLKSLPEVHKIPVNNAHSEEENDNNFSGFAGIVSCLYGNA